VLVLLLEKNHAERFGANSSSSLTFSSSLAGFLVGAGTPHSRPLRVAHPTVFSYYLIGFLKSLIDGTCINTAYTVGEITKRLAATALGASASISGGRSYVVTYVMVELMTYREEGKEMKRQKMMSKCRLHQ